MARAIYILHSVVFFINVLDVISFVSIMGKAKSEVWNNFEKVEQNKVKCKLCEAMLSYSGSTGTMLNHLKLKHSHVTTKPVEKTQPTIRSYVSVRKCDASRMEKISNLIAEMVARDCLPISVVEGQGFKALMEYIEPNYTVPSRKTITSRLRTIHDRCKSNVQEKLDKLESISITTDCWTSLANDSYMTVTAHAIDSEWNKMSLVLDTAELEERHTAVNLATAMNNVTSSWKITDKVTSIVHDNASNVARIAEFCDSEAEDVGCTAHKLQLCVNGALDDKVISKMAARASKIVGHFKHSNVANNALETKQEEMSAPKHRLIQSCKTRWNSTCDMLERLIEQRWPVCAVLSDRRATKAIDSRDLEFNNDQWELAEQLVKVLKPLKVS